jgi:DNA-directed RNA polymerase specialized sigma24 family protein
MRELGIESQAELARRSGVSLQVVNNIVCLRKAPKGHRDAWLAGVEDIAAALLWEPEEMFSDAQLTMHLKSNSVERFISEEQAVSLMAGDMEEQCWVRHEATRLLSAIPDKRDRECVERAVMHGEQIGQIAADLGVSNSRVTQMVARGLRRAKAKSVAGHNTFRAEMLAGE